MDDIHKEVVALQDLDENAKGLKRIPPGFTRGLRLPGDEDEVVADLLLEIQVPSKLHSADNPVRVFSIVLSCRLSINMLL